MKSKSNYDFQAVWNYMLNFFLNKTSNWWRIKFLAIWNWNHEKTDTDSNYVKNATIVKYLYNIVFNIIDTNVG